MTQLLFIATIYQVVSENLVEVGNPIHLFTLKELQSLILNTFPGEITYLTKESESKESCIKSTTNTLKFIHLLEM